MNKNKLNNIEREQHLFAVANSVQDAIVSADTSGNILFWNEGAKKSFGYEQKEVVGKSLSIIMPERYREIHQKGMNRYLKTGEKQVIGNVVQLHGLRKDGTEFPIELSLGVWENGSEKYFTGVIRDISERVKAENTLLQVRSALDASEDGVFMFSPDTLKFFYVNAGAIKQVGYSRQELMQMTPIDIKPLFTEETFRKTVAPLISGEIENHFFTTVHRHKNGTDIPVEIILQNVTSKEGEKMFVAMARDITERQRVENALRENENKMRTLLDSMSEGLIQVNENEIIEFVNDRFCQMIGYERNEILGKTTFDFLYDEKERDGVKNLKLDRRKGITGDYEMKLLKKSGEVLYVIVGGASLTNGVGEITGSMGVFTDITERKKIEEQLIYDAFHDALTGLANRALFMNHLKMTIERCRNRNSKDYGILFLDFDRFKVVNDNLGHSEGDELLKQIGKRLEVSVRSGDLVARFGGDEFVILLSELSHVDESLIVAERIMKCLKEPFKLSKEEIYISASIGIALSSAGHKCAEDMLRDADIAMYRAKSNGKSNYQIFDQSMHEEASKHLSVETEMRRGLENGEFELHYQPIYSLELGVIKGFEALVRWRHPERGIIPPIEFLPAAEENGLILQLGKWILNESCRQLKEWQSQNQSLSHITMSVNVSAKQFVQIDMTKKIAFILERNQLDPKCLRLEITETELMKNSEAVISAMKKLNKLGVLWSLDDFGTGYSSLSFLHSLPVGFLKIDRSFVSEMDESDEKFEIINTIIRLAKSLKMRLIAEGIEDQSQLTLLKELGCEFGQGYLFARPMDAKSTKQFIDENIESFSYYSNEPSIELELIA